MSKPDSSSRIAAHATALALVAGFATAAPAYATGFGGHDSGDTDSYMAGDFHNHTTCTDGTVSVETMVTTSVKTYDLEWLASADHGGSGTRDCRINDPEGNGPNTGEGKYWEQTIGAAAIEGDVLTSNSNGQLNDPAFPPVPHNPRVMWRWQMIDQIVHPEIARLSKKLHNPMLYTGLESNVPGHEHLSTTILGSQRPFNWYGNIGNAGELSEWEYRFDRSDNDRSGKGGTPGTPESGLWLGKVANASNVVGSGTLMHTTKAVPSVAWLQAKFPLDSYYVPAHTERAGAFNPDHTGRGWNIEHFRDFNNVGPTVAVGFETMPGHQAAATRGEYQVNFCGAGCNSVGVTTYGGSGIYGAKVGGVWDGLLGEGRNFFFFASSDWHNRGMFSPFEKSSTQDFYPGEYQKLYIPRPTHHSFFHDFNALRPQHVVDSVRAGNSFSVTGDLISGELTFEAEIEGGSKYRHLGWNQVAKMGETLVVPRGKDVRITLTVTDPRGANNSPYSFANPSLKQIGKTVPLNKPVLDHVDFIRGNITGLISPSNPAYKRPAGSPDDFIYNASAKIDRTFGGKGYANKWKELGEKRTISFVIKNIQNNQYIRVRGTNLPVGTPNETDAKGNPLSDLPVSVIPCKDAACPAHMQVDAAGNKFSSFDVAGWSDLWFYANPIFIRVKDQPKLYVEKAHECAERSTKEKVVECAAVVTADATK